MEIQETGKGESRRQAASACSRTGGRRKAGVGGNSSQILSGTKIVPATWQESVQMSQIQEPGPFPHSYNCTRSKLVRFMDQKIPWQISVPSLGMFLSPQSTVYQSDGNANELFLPKWTIRNLIWLIKKKVYKAQFKYEQLLLGKISSAFKLIHNGYYHSIFRDPLFIIDHFYNEKRDPQHCGQLYNPLCFFTHIMHLFFHLHFLCIFIMQLLLIQQFYKAERAGTVISILQKWKLRYSNLPMVSHMLSVRADPGALLSWLTEFFSLISIIPF